jgi:hypothetical protein
MQNNSSLPKWQLGDNIHGKTYGEWTGEFWKWLLNFPIASGPGRSAYRDLSQTDLNVIFLSGILDIDGGLGDTNENKVNIFP